MDALYRPQSLRATFRWPPFYGSPRRTGYVYSKGTSGSLGPTLTDRYPPHVAIVKVNTSGLIRPYAECRIMPSAAGERQRGDHRILGALGIIRAPTGTPEVRRLA
jgi:hypothetical protein